MLVGTAITGHATSPPITLGSLDLARLEQLLDSPAVRELPGAAALGAEGPAAAWVAAIFGGTLAATAHTAKMTARAAVNTSPEPFSNLLVSLAEDGVVVLMLWLATAHPVVFAIALALTLALSVLLMVLLFKFLRAVLRGLSAFFTGHGRPRLEP